MQYNQRKTYLVEVIGAAGSGKSTLVAALDASTVGAMPVTTLDRAVDSAVRRNTALPIPRGWRILARLIPHVLRTGLVGRGVLRIYHERLLNTYRETVEPALAPFFFHANETSGRTTLEQYQLLKRTTDCLLKEAVVRDTDQGGIVLADEHVLQKYLAHCFSYTTEDYRTPEDTILDARKPDAVIALMGDPATSEARLQARDVGRNASLQRFSPDERQTIIARTNTFSQQLVALLTAHQIPTLVLSDSEPSYDEVRDFLHQLSEAGA